jgi:hypothetical protein
VTWCALSTVFEPLKGVELPIASGTDCLTLLQRTSDPLLVDLPRDFDTLPFLEEFSRSFELDSHFFISTCLKDLVLYLLTKIQSGSSWDGFTTTMTMVAPWLRLLATSVALLAKEAHCVKRLP